MLQGEDYNEGYKATNRAIHKGVVKSIINVIGMNFNLCIFLKFTSKNGASKATIPEDSRRPNIDINLAHEAVPKDHLRRQHAPLRQRRQGLVSALLLDCDGVLADTERDGHLPAFNQTFE